MRKFFPLFVFIGVVVTLWAVGSLLSAASVQAALTGIVSSDAEGPMEGVLVSAKRVGGTITVTVISDKQGRYSFPKERLTPGHYNLSIRAIGYDPADPAMTATIAKGETKANIRLNKTKDLAAQLSDAEWLASMPGTFEQKQYLFINCARCHTLAPILKSTYDQAGWMTTFVRMRGWDDASSISRPLPSPEAGPRKPYGNEEFAKFLSSINLSSKSTHDFEMKAFPRPSGEDTKVIITEYDLSRPDAQPHDVAVEPNGTIWYDDFVEGILGRLNPGTGELKEWQDPLPQPGVPSSFQDLEFDGDGNPWIGRHDFNGLAKFDKKTEKFSNFTIPPGTRASFIAITRDGKIWAKTTPTQRLFRLDPLTGETTLTSNALPPDMMNKGQELYGIAVDSKGNVFGADTSDGGIFNLDVSGKIMLHITPTPNSGPRRVHMDSQDQLWIGEYYAKKIARLDTKTDQFQEWPVPIEWYGVYDVAAAKDGNVWTGAMTSDAILRLNPKTGVFRSYLMPRLGINVRRVDVDNSGPQPVFWVGENHQAKIAKVEPLE